MKGPELTPVMAADFIDKSFNLLLIRAVLE
jgi:hypothetical protein